MLLRVITTTYRAAGRFGVERADSAIATLVLVRKFEATFDTYWNNPVGSIKWRDCNPFDQRDLADLAAHRAEVPGGRDAPLIAVSRSGCTARDLAAIYSPGDLVSA